MLFNAGTSGNWPEFWIFAVCQNNLSLFCGLFVASFNTLNAYSCSIYIENEHKHEWCISLNSELFLKIGCHDKCNSWISVIYKLFKYIVIHTEIRICYYAYLSVSISVSLCDKVSKMCMQFYQMHCLLKLNTAVKQVFNLFYWS